MGTDPVPPGHRSDGTAASSPGPEATALTSGASSRRRDPRAGRSDGEDDLADDVAGEHRLEPLARVGERDASCRSGAGRPSRRRGGRAARARPACPSSSRSPDSCRKNTRLSCGRRSASPVVAPETTSVPPGLSERIECSQVALPTVSITTSTRSGSRSPDSNARSAPSDIAVARFSSERLVTHTRAPAALASTTSAVATPPAAPWTSTVIPGTTWPRVNSIR